MDLTVYPVLIIQWWNSARPWRRMKKISVRNRIVKTINMTHHMWSELCIESEGDPWRHREAKQALRDCLTAFKATGLIEDFWINEIKYGDCLLKKTKPLDK